MVRGFVVAVLLFGAVGAFAKQKTPQPDAAKSKDSEKYSPVDFGKNAAQRRRQNQGANGRKNATEDAINNAELPSAFQPRP
jgi:hypothetical protein